MTAWRKFWYLSSEQKRLLAEAVALLACVRVGLRVLPFRTLRRALELSPTADAASIERVTWAVTAAVRRVRGTTCLATALIVCTMLRRHGHESVLRIGVRQTDRSQLEAHAWVECQGTIVIGEPPEMTGYAVLA